MRLKKLTIIPALFILMSCATTTLLRDGQVAPVNPKVFKNRVYFDQSILTQVDTTVIYEEYNDNFYIGLEKQPDVLQRLNYKDVNTYYGVYRFYGNGCFSFFSPDRKKPELTSDLFNPAYTGWRGVLYKKKNKIQGDEFTQIGQLSFQLGKKTQEFTFNGDTLIVDFKNVHKYTYIKRHIDPKLLEHNADW